LSSTPAYPDWTVAALLHVSESLASDVARGLLAMDGEDTARWDASVSSARVATLFDDLALHPLAESLLARLAAAQGASPWPRPGGHTTGTARA